MKFKLFSLFAIILLLNDQAAYSCRFCCGGGDEDGEEHRASSNIVHRETSPLLGKEKRDGNKSIPERLVMDDGTSGSGPTASLPQIQSGQSQQGQEISEEESARLLEAGKKSAKPPATGDADEVEEKKREEAVVAERKRIEEAAAAEQREVDRRKAEELQKALTKQTDEADRLAIALDTEKARAAKLIEEKRLADLERARLQEQLAERDKQVEQPVAVVAESNQLEQYRTINHGGGQWLLPAFAEGPNEQGQITLTPKFGSAWGFDNFEAACLINEDVSEMNQEGSNYRKDWANVLKAVENTSKDVMKMAGTDGLLKLKAQKYNKYLLDIIMSVKDSHDRKAHELYSLDFVPVKIQRDPDSKSSRILIMLTKQAGWLIKFP
jgi:hypothetical protein